MASSITLANYNIHFTDGAHELASLIEVADNRQVVLFCDSNTARLCVPLLETHAPQLKHALMLEMPAGEQHKNLGACDQVWETLFDNHIGRDALWINLGGGVVSDMGGFIASVYTRGIDFINIPTTVLAQVDATVGGKLGIDFRGYKNGIGLFQNPQLIIVCPDFLQTLPETEVYSGFSEMLKHGLIQDEAYLNGLMELQPKNLLQRPELIKRSVQMKKRVVEEDPREGGYRKVLNFGHTIGHAIEGEYLLQGKPIPHGFAVGLGMVAELHLSARVMGFPQKKAERVIKYLLGLYGSSLSVDISIDNLAKLAANDKKNRGNTMNFSLLKDIGEPVVDVEVDEEGFRWAVAQLINHL